jgi:hypothetical protein
MQKSSSNRFLACLIIAILIGIALRATPVWSQLFESDSKRFGNSKMDIRVKEIERRERSSVIQIDIKSAGSSVGGSFFLLCSIRDLALERGGYRHIVKIEEYPKPGQMLIGFLRGDDENPAILGPEFRKISGRDAVIDLDKFAELCGKMK